MKRILQIGCTALMVLLLTSCLKQGSWFPDMDCVTKQIEVTSTLTPNTLPPQGGRTTLEVNVAKITHFWQYGKEFKQENQPLDYSVALLNNPDGYQLLKEGDSYVLSVPVNNRSSEVTITLVVTAGDHQQQFTLTQQPRKYRVDVEIQ